MGATAVAGQLCAEGTSSMHQFSLGAVGTSSGCHCCVPRVPEATPTFAECRKEHSDVIGPPGSPTAAPMHGHA